MNRKYGLAATAWMLGGSFLLDAGLTAEAQVLTTQPAINAKAASLNTEEKSDNPSLETTPSRTQANHAVYEGLTPNKITRRVRPIGHEEETSANKTPRLLSDFLRSTDKPIGDNSQEPASKAPFSAGHKILGTNAASNRPSTSAKSPTRASRPGGHTDIQTAGLDEAAPVSQPNSQNGFAPSPIQQQLEDMYRREGRQVPQSNFQQTPINVAPPPSTARSQFQTPGSRPAVMPKGQIQRPAPMPSLGPSNPNVVPPNSKISRTGGLLGRINPFKNRSAATPSQPPALAPTPMGAADKPASDPKFKQPQSTLVPNGTGGSTQPAPMILQPAAAPTALPQASSATTANVPSRSELSNTLPPVPGDPDFKATTNQTNPAASVDDALENAFAEMEEDAADGKSTDSKSTDDSEAESSPKEGSPFSGLSLDSVLPIPPEAPAVEAAGSSGSTTDTDSDTENDSKAKAENQDVASSNETSDEQPSEKGTDAKLKLIAERTELQGLKGFCPVALRDDRDLQNALPEHASLFKGRTYYFSSADAKATFDEQPEQYAPMAGGNDVVLLKSKDTKEGSLDFAVWYKDRLYLFTSQKTLEQFVATPREFVVKE